MISPRLEPHRGAYLLPNLLTSLALFAGFFAIVAAIDGNFATAASAIVVAMVFDALDGRVARLTGTATPFGREFDSLTDMIAFGLAPAVVVYQWGVERLTDYHLAWGRLGWLVTFSYVVAAAMRLARFNAAPAGSTPDRHFIGLPSPSAAALVAAFVWLSARESLAGLGGLLLALVVTAAAAALMISPVHYRSFKELSLTATVVFALVALAGAAVLLFDPPLALLVVFGAYALSGIASEALAWWRRRESAAAATGAAGDDER
ncbi:MAG: CDP-diacylglycerol--serine O-phosphatidyltransferase [Pseudomonadota bacterium]